MSRKRQRTLLRLEELERRELLDASAFPDTNNGNIYLLSDQVSTGLSSSMIQFIATHFVGAEKLLSSYNDQFKAYNPNWVLLNYRLATESGPAQYIVGDQWGSDWSTVNSHEDWFMHNASGQRLYNSTFDWYLNDISNPNFDNYWTSSTISSMRQTGAVGIMADSFDAGLGGWWFSNYDVRFAGTNAGNPAYWPNGVTWIDQLNKYIQTVQNAYHATPEKYVFIPNVGALDTGWDTTNYQSLDGAFLEGFGVGPGYMGDNTGDWVLGMDRALPMSAAGKVLIMQPWLKNGPNTTAGLEQRGYELGTYLLLQGQHTFFNLVGGGGSTGAYYYPEDTIHMGNPLTPTATDVSQYAWDGIYRRDFQNGIVLVNPTKNTVTINLGQSYNQLTYSGGGALSSTSLDANGNYIGGSVQYKPVSTVTLAPSTAAILMNPSTTLTWTGGGSNRNWSNPQNWGGQTPVAGDSLVFGPGTSSLTSTNDLVAGTKFNSITFSGAGYTVGGNAVTLTGGINASNATGNNTLSLGISLANDETINGGGSGTNLTITGAVNNQGHTLTVAGGSGTVTLANTLSGSGSLKETSSGTLVLSSANSYAGGTVLNAGKLSVGNGSAMGSGALTLDGGTLSSSGAAQKLANAVIFGGNATIGASSTLTLTGPVTLTGNETLNVGTGATVTISGVIAQSGATAYSLTKSGSGTLILSGANTYSGGTKLSAGTLKVGNALALGSGKLTLSGGTLSSSGAAQTLTNAVTLGGNASIGASSALTFSGPVTLTGNRTLTVGSGATVTVTGSIGQSGSTAYALSKSGSGTLVLSGANKYTGSTTVNAGTLLIDGSQAGGTVHVAKGAVLGGSGVMGPVSVSAGGTLQPGATLGASGLLSSGNVSFSSGSIFTVSLNGATAGAGGYDQLKVSGSVNLGGSTLKLSLGFTPTVGESFTILNNSGGGAVVGTFANLPEGGKLTSGGMTFRISYVGGNGKSVVLTRIA